MILTDAMALLYRSHFAFSMDHRLRTTTGEDTTVLFGFLATLLSLLELTPPPTHLAVVMDASGKTFRHEIYPDYKAHRPQTPPEVIAATPQLRELLRAMGIAEITLPGVEADDVIGTLAVRGVEAGMAVAVASPDKDFFQLLRPGLVLLRPPKKAPALANPSATPGDQPTDFRRPAKYSKYALMPYSESDFSADWGGLSPKQFVDVLALMGDASDNIPGVVGIGAKTAIAILKQYDTLEEALEKASSGELLPKGAAAKLNAPNMAEAARLSKTLVEIRTSLDLPPAQIPFDDLRLKIPADDGTLARALLEKLQFKTHETRLMAVWKRMQSNDGQVR
jgi:DNA polymerase I